MQYKIQAQESITSISEKFGLNDLTIWNHKKNTELKNKRPDLNNLLAGDIVFIPEIENQNFALVGNDLGINDLGFLGALEDAFNQRNVAESYALPPNDLV